MMVKTAVGSILSFKWD